MNWKCFIRLHKFVYKSSQEYENYFKIRNIIDGKYFGRISEQRHHGWVQR